MAHAAEVGTFSFVLQTDGKVISSFGDIDGVSRIHSVRKAVLSALVVQYLDEIDMPSQTKSYGHEINTARIPTFNRQSLLNYE